MRHSWQDFAQAEPELAALVARHLSRGTITLATVDQDGMPRIDIVLPLIEEGYFLLGVDKDTPAWVNLQRGSGYALHGIIGQHRGELLLTGHAAITEVLHLKVLARMRGRLSSALFELNVETVYSQALIDGERVIKRWKAWTKR